MDINKKLSQFIDVESTDSTTLIPVVQGSPLFNAKITPKKFADSIKPYVLKGMDFPTLVSRLDTNDIEISDLKSNKVDKVIGKSLVDDSEIQRLANVTNQTVPTKTSEIINDSGFIDTDDLADLGGGDMLKSIYDTDNSGVVDNAEKVNGLTVETAVPLDAKFTDTITDVSGLATKLELEDKVDKEYGMTLIDEEEVTRLSTVVNQDLSGLATKEEVGSKVDKVEGKSLIDDAEIARLSGVSNQDISNLATKDELENLVVKEAGKSLILDTEIERLESVTNQTLEGLGAEDANNKKSLLNPLSETEYPNSKAVADYVTDSLPEDNRDTLNQVTATGTYTLPLNRQTQITEELTGSNTFILTDPFEGIVNESVVHFRVGSEVPTLAYDFTPKWLNESVIELKADKSYTIVFEQLKQGVEWIIKASWGEY